MNSKLIDVDFLFLFKQKTAYEMRSSDWSSDVCSSDLTPAGSGGRVLVNGAATTGSRTITGLEPGDEISVIFDDDSGRSAYSLIYLPTRFPILERTTPASSAVAPGHVLLSLSDFGVGSPFFETAVDRNGVPVHVHTEWSSAIDFKQQPNGAFTSSRQSAATTGRSGGALVELGEDLEPASVHQTVGRNNTDGHDSIRRSEEHTSELQSLMRISYAVFCLKKKKKKQDTKTTQNNK